MENGLLLLLDEAGQQLFRAATHSAASSADAVKSAIE
jgi:hypothetical protein